MQTFTWSFLAFSLGTCIGSFLNVCIYRLPQEKSVVRPGSACPKCGHRLKWWENIPILSFLFLRAKCRSCGARISLQYPMVELLSGLLALALWYKFGLGPEVLIYFYFSACLIIVTFVDLAHQIIPDAVSLPGIREGMGGGDIKLLAMIGAFLGWQAIPLVILLSAAVGSVTGLAIMSVRKGDRHMAISYGPFLAGAALITLFWGRELTTWYLVFISRG
ncbi:MAG: prepilin peptidase [Deltaproteobacteria bacterium]|nr:prepilin peptidase [Deltaproteobacteria bacterium]